MYKIYLSPSNQDKSFGVGDFGSESFRMNEIADVVEKELLALGNFAVYRNKEYMTKEEIITHNNEIKPYVHIAIHSNYGNKQGVESYPKVGCEISNGFAKEIYKSLQRIYYDKTKDAGVIYDEKIVEINKVNSPAVLIQVGYHDNTMDSKWMVQNIDEIGMAIVKGIVEGFKLKNC